MDIQARQDKVNIKIVFKENGITNHYTIIESKTKGVSAEGRAYRRWD